MYIEGKKKDWWDAYHAECKSVKKKFGDVMHGDVFKTTERMVKTNQNINGG